MAKKSFFERLTGAINTEDDAFLDDPFEEAPTPRERKKLAIKDNDEEHDWIEEEAQSVEEAQLTVDVYQTPEDIVIKTIVAGIDPDELDVSITREMVTIRGARPQEEGVQPSDYFHQELYWGAFSRTILLPEEIEVEEAEATEQHGLLSIRLPKIDKKRKTKLKVRRV